MKIVRVAALQFITGAERQTDGAHEVVLAETRDALDKTRGYGIDLVCLGEGVEAYGQALDQAESLDEPGPYLSLYREFATSGQCHVAGSTKLREDGCIYNAIVVAAPDGTFAGAYRKTFLTDGEREDGLTPGPGAGIIETSIGRLGGIICFDLNFEPLRVAYRALKPDILVFASMYHGGLMQGMWAYDCRCFFVSSLHLKEGGILDPYGRPLSITNCYTDWVRHDLNLDRVMVHIDHNNVHFTDIERKYGDEVRIETPPNVGSVLIYSESDGRTALDIAHEFGLELLDDYFARNIRENDEGRV